MRGSDTLFSQCQAKNSTQVAYGLQEEKSTEAPVYPPHVLLSLVIHSFLCHWRLTVTADSQLGKQGLSVTHHAGLVDLHHLLRMMQLFFHSSEHDLHSFSPKPLSQLRNQLHCLLRCLSLKQH